jgi:hypothetical protein
MENICVDSCQFVVERGRFPVPNCDSFNSQFAICNFAFHLGAIRVHWCELVVIDKEIPPPTGSNRGVAKLIKDI